jgi:hypothetical protein
MKLKHVAALMFRVLGVVFILFGGAGAVVSGVGRDLCGALVNGGIGFVFGFCLMFLNKKLASLFCRGLDDEPWPNTALEPTAAAHSVSDAPSNPKAGSESKPASSGGGSA